MRDYPTLFKLILDILPIQASSVPCERVFSSSKETCTLRRLNISPIMLEALQFLKYLFRQLDFTSAWIPKESECLADDDEIEVARELMDGGKIAELAALINEIYQD
jgi:hypothetical protein